MSGQIRLGLLYLGSRPAARAVEVARYAEGAGFSYFWVPDERFFREVYGLCAAVAGTTGQILVGPCVTDPFTRHPTLSAMALATLDEISDGRAVLGIGAGISGFAELGIERKRTARRVSEAIELIGLLLTGEPVDFHGDVLSFSGRLNFTPIRQRIPIYLAAAGPMMLRAAGKLADGVIIEACVAPGTLERALESVELGASDAGRNLGEIDIVARIDVAVDESLDRAYDVLRPRIARKLMAAAPGFGSFQERGLDVPDGLRELIGDGGYTWDADQLAKVGKQVPRDYIDAFTIAATPDTLGERLDELVRRGATQIIVNPIPTHADAVEPTIDAVAAWHVARSEQVG